MPLTLADRVRDTTTTTGTGTVTLSGTAPTGYQNFSVIGNGNTTYYTINAGSQWEVGIGTYSSTGPTLSRDTVLSSSAGGTTKVSFSAGTKDVFVTYPASKAISDGYGTLPVANGGLGVATLGSNYLFKGAGTSPVVQSVIYDDGTNVGIGTSSPSEKLVIGGGGNLLLAGASTGDQSIRVGSGRSGNGYSYIDLQGDTTYSNGLRLIRTNGGANSASNIEHRGTGALQLVTQEAAPILFYTSASERMRIESSGNVGIGTSSPGSKLTVAGTIESTTGGVKYPDATTQTTGVLEQVDVYSTTGSSTWTKPSWAKAVIVILIGGGGGGGSGRKGASSTVRTGGAGGGGGAYSTTIFSAPDLTSTVTVTVGAGGGGGAAISADSTNGNAGTGGGASSFGTYIYAMGGTGGGGGSTSSTGAGVGGVGTVIASSAANNGATTGNAVNVTATSAAQSGAAGGPLTSANAVVGGGQGSNTTNTTAPRWKGTTLNTPTASTVTGTGASGTDHTQWLGGESGDGGGASATGNAGNGGAGGKWGGGGGGGGAALNAVGNSGAGGDGAAGLCVVISQG